jgi:hypothetical protein
MPLNCARTCSAEVTKEKIVKTKQLLRYAQLAADYPIWSNDDPQAYYLAGTFDLGYRSDITIIDIGEERREIFESLAYDNTNGPKGTQ